MQFAHEKKLFAIDSNSGLKNLNSRAIPLTVSPPPAMTVRLKLILEAQK
jgi:hypothetical protein